jgi:ElaB/YqjD/DUF883 family membrane-anchored ribosome-binding protein
MPETSTAEHVINEISETAEYVREHAIKDMVNDVTSWVKAHPTQALLGALALGFLASVLLRRH